MAAKVVEYNATPTLTEFHLSPKFVRGVRGPVGSGKSTACCWEIWRRINEQTPAPEGKRKTRFAVIRNTYRELLDTTLLTWLDWFPEEAIGKFNYGDMSHRIGIGNLDAEIMFRALDRPQDVKKLLSLELTGAWVNEAREVPKSIIDALGDRIGRYPSVRDGGCTWRGLIMDTNSPDSDHWWYKAAEEGTDLRGKPIDLSDWAFFSQPPGVLERDGKWVTNPEAENLTNLEPRYYETRTGGKSRDHILVYYANQYGFVRDGKPVYPEYFDSVHAAKEPLALITNRIVYVGIDYGLTPAAVLGQKDVMGRWRWIDEVVTEDMGAVRFAEVLGSVLRSKYAGYQLEIYGDPSGDDRAQTDETTPQQILNGKGIPVIQAPTNDPVIRREAVAGALNRMIDGQPGLLISPKCAVTRKGMAGGYAYRRMQVSGDEKFHDKPDKNKFSHPCEAAQYMMLGAGETDRVILPSKTWSQKLDYSTISKGVV